MILYSSQKLICVILNHYKHLCFSQQNVLNLPPYKLHYRQLCFGNCSLIKSKF